MSTANTSPGKDNSPHGLASLEQALKEEDAGHVSLVLVRIEDLPEMRSIYGSAIYQSALRTIQLALLKIVRGRGFGARTAPTEYTLALPNMYRREALALLSAQLGQTACFEIDADGEDIVLTPEISVDLVGPSESVRQCHNRLRSELVKSIDRERARLAGMTKSREHLAMRAAKALETDVSRSSTVSNFAPCEMPLSRGA